MLFNINQKLMDAYKQHGKNPNYALTFLLNSIDAGVCADNMELISSFVIEGDTGVCEIDESNLCAVMSIFGSAEAYLIERLLWIALLFPEI